MTRRRQPCVHFDTAEFRPERIIEGMNQMILSTTEEWTSSLPPRPAAAPAPASSSSSSKRRFVKLGRKTSDDSVQSASSTGSSAEGAAVRQPSKSRIRRQTNRLSGVFLRGPASSSGSMALTSSLRTSLSVQTRKSSMICADALVADDPSELSNQITAPGILKIFGNEICEGAHYKSVLATTHSSAKELVKEALERYGLSKEEAESYVLCDTIGSIDQRRWRTEGFRVVGDNEKPLLLQSLWKPREGLARRFEIQRRSSVEEKTAKDKDTVTAGLNAQARKLQKSRSRVASTLIDRAVAQSHKLWRSKSEMDLLDPDADARRDAVGDHDRFVKDRSGSLNQTSSLLPQCKTSPEQNGIHGLALVPADATATESLCPPRPRGEREGEESEREETESSDDNTTQYSIHPPYDWPYLLLLQGCSPAQDYVIYLLAGTKTAIGRQGDQGDGSKLDILLFATDILSPSHCYLHRPGVGAATTLCPRQGAVVTRNGEVLKEEVQLSPGDVVGLGQFYLFLFKDPLNLTHKGVNSSAPESGPLAVPWMLGHNASTDHTAEMNLCDSRTSTCTDLQSVSSKRVLSVSRPPCLKSSEGHSLTLNYEAEDEDRIVKEIVDVGGTELEDRPPLTAAFLLCICIQHSSTCLHKSDLRRLLLLIASGVQSAMWEHTKDLAAVQPEILNDEGPESGDLQTLGLHDVISGLRPLVVWMSNSLELLQFIQYQLPLLLEWRSRNEQGLEEEEEEGEEEDEERSDASSELHLSCVRSARQETMAVLEEVIMLAFQQCVYYITKILYPILPGLLDCNPFRKTPERQATASAAECVRVLGTSGLQVPGEVQQVVEVLNEAWLLLADCQVHPEISSQLVGYVFYFVSASLVNSLMERGSEPGFYQWSRGVRMRASLDLILDWAHTAGHGETALEQTHTLASAINLLATPRKNLLQTSWKSLRSHFAALSPAQLNHLLTLYSPGSPCRRTWTPAAQDQAAVLRTAEILESFDTQHPLVLPGGGHQFQLRRSAVAAAADSALKDELDKLGEFVSSLRKTTPSAEDHHQNGRCLQATVQNHLPPSVASPPSPPSQPSPPSANHRHEKLRHLELQITDTTSSSSSSEMRRSAAAPLDPSCLLTPPNTPHHMDHDEAATDKRTKPDVETPPWTSDVDNEGGLVFECLAALKVDRLKADCPSMKQILEIKEEEEEEEEEQDNHYDDNNDEVFSLELERGERGLGLSLVDTRETSFRVKGVFIQSVVPDSPAARCEKLAPGDQILAVNGVSLLGLDYKSGKELIQSSGERLRLLVTRCDWMAKAMETGC